MATQTQTIPMGQADRAVNPARISQTHGLIEPHIRQTPLLNLAGADFGLDGVRLALKLELLQHSGSFKARGAFANLLLRQCGHFVTDFNWRAGGFCK